MAEIHFDLEKYDKMGNKYTESFRAISKAIMEGMKIKMTVFNFKHDKNFMVGFESLSQKQIADLMYSFDTATPKNIQKWLIGALTKNKCVNCGGKLQK